MISEVLHYKTWRHYEKQIVKLLSEHPRAYDRHLDIEDILRYLDEGSLTAWLFARDSLDDPELLMLTEIVDYPKARVMMVTCLVGRNFKEYYAEKGEEFENIARWMGCTKIEIVCRHGFKKLLRGYSNPNILLVKELRRVA